MVNKANHVRIIAGQFRSRKLQFPNTQLLRPTTDRIKETLFNWLGNRIVGATCLDCFAGSGSLGFEAISRGAKFVTFLESNANVANAIQLNCQKLNTEANTKVILYDAIAFLQHPADNAADIIFLDPPYQQSLLYQSLDLIIENGWAHTESFIYIEDNKPIEVDLTQWSINRTGKAGNVYFALLKHSL